jgi:hypothetical protein
MSVMTSFCTQQKRLLLIFLFVGLISACSADGLISSEPTTLPADVVSTQVAATVKAQTTVNSTAVTATLTTIPTIESEPTAVIPSEAQITETAVSASATQAVSSASTQTANTFAQQTRTAQDLSTAQASYVIPELRALDNYINVRNGPGTEYLVISTLNLNQTVPVIAKNNWGDWFVIELPGGVKGWVHNSVTAPVSTQAMAQIGVAVTIPAPPPPTPTATYTPTPVPPTDTPTPFYTDGTLYATNTGFDSICFLYISPSSNSDWGADWLGSDVLDSGNTLAITVEAGWYDLLAEDCNGNQTVETDVYISAGGSFNWNIYIEPIVASTSITVSNWLDESVCYLYISPASSSEWGDDWLGDDVLEPYGSLIFYLNDDSYDLKATDCDGFDLDIEGPIYISGDSYWDIGN